MHFKRKPDHYYFLILDFPMERKKLSAKSRLMLSSSSPAAPPPSPVPTAKGSRSAVDPILSEYIDKSMQLIPELTLPKHVIPRFKIKPEEIDYEPLISRETESVRRLLGSFREFGVVQLNDHGISTEELRFALVNSERIFGLTVECCSSYGDHEKIVWRRDDRQIMEEATAAIGQQKLQIFRQKMENVDRQLEAIAQELGEIIGGSGGKQSQESIHLGTPTLSIYRYHRANIIDRISSVIDETRQESAPYGLSLHLLLEWSEFSMVSSRGKLSFDTGPKTIVVTMGKELEEWSHGEFKSAQGKLIFKPFLHSNRPSFSIEQKWSVSDLRNIVGDSDIIISLADQILIVLLILLTYKFFTYICS